MPQPDAIPLADLVDLRRYPIDRLEHDAGRGLVAECQAALDSIGCIVLPDFIAPGALAAMAEEARTLSGRAHFHDIRTNPYGSAGDPALPADHPVNLFDERSNGFVGGDLMAPGSAIRQLYRHEALIAFLSACMRVAPLYVYADPIADAVVNLLRPGRRFCWHFDNNDYTITVMTQAPEGGGIFEFCPNLRSADDQRFAAVTGVLQGDRRAVRQLTLRPGDLQIFYGRNSLHRVTRVEGDRERHTVIFAYVEDPLRLGSVERTQRIYGRVHPRHLAAAAEARSRDAL